MDEVLSEEAITHGVQEFAKDVSSDPNVHWLICPNQPVAETASGQLIRTLSLQEASQTEQDRRIVLDLTSSQLERVMTENRYTQARFPHVIPTLLAAALFDHAQELGLDEVTIRAVIEKLPKDQYSTSSVTNDLLYALNRNKTKMSRGPVDTLMGIASDPITTIEAAETHGLNTSLFPRYLARSLPDEGVKMLVATRPLEEVRAFVHKRKDTLMTGNGFDNDTQPLQRQRLTSYIT